MTEMVAHRNFYDLEEDRAEFDDCIVKSLLLNHPQGCLGFRMETDNAIFVYATDNEPGPPVFDHNVRKLAEGADVLVYDAQYLPAEYEARRRGWGHSHWREAVAIARESGVKELVLFHHDPDHDDPCLDSIVQAACEFHPRTQAAREGLVIEL
jgi:ribonuclease BN (tRNA processing enzyme)